MTITLITASAGTGKTHRLVDEIERALTDADAPLAPEHLVAVTYTRRAAAELEERVRQRLIRAGHVELAHRLGAARIGTVHAVCQRLIEDFAFELGLSPELRTLDEHLAEHALADVLAEVMNEDEVAAQADLAQRMEEMRSFAWHLKELVDHARAHGLGPEELTRAGSRSRARLIEVLPGPVGDAEKIEADFLAALDAAVGDATLDVDNLNDRDLRAAKTALHALRNGHDVPWSRWLSLGRVGPSSRAHVFHPKLREDLLRAHDLVYSVAVRGLEQYARSKRAWGVVDFVDQEMHALTLLRRADLRARLADEIRFVLVDEVQDTSPQQLEIFRALGEVAQRSLWVGDRKQSIFGFRGADASVLDEAIVRDVGALPEPLTVSRRSRAPLVALTSAVFSRAFARHDARSGDARLDPLAHDDPSGLGAILEWWDPDALEERGAHESSLEPTIARGVQSLLADEQVRVRDRHTGALRRPVAGDVAILVRRNAAARRVARALDDVGIRAVLRRSGLGRSLEARVLRAALVLWLDAGDLLAAAELKRVLEDEGPERFMERLATGDVADGVVGRVRAMAEQQRGAGVVRAFDCIVEALGLVSWCARVHEGAQRRANLAALRALAVRFVEEAHARGRGATVAGLIARLDALAHARAADEDDQVGTLEDSEAVHIVTWHGAKGLEWPIVVLAELGSRRTPTVFGLTSERDGDRRWPRMWMSPYAAARQSWMKGGLHEKTAQTPEAIRARSEGDAEELRVLYVAWTRARDRLVLVGTEADLQKKGPIALLDPPALGRRARWAGVDVACDVRRLVREAASPPPVPSPLDYAPVHARFETPAFVQPSAAEATGVVLEEVELGDALLVDRMPDEEEATRLGSALHAVFGAWQAWPAAERVQLIERALARHRVRGILSVDACWRAAERLEVFAARLGAASQRTEVPVVHRRDDASLVRGQIDLLLRGPQGDLIVDHKTYVADVATSRAKAATFAGQLRMYADAVAASGRPVTATWIHMPIAARMFRVA